MFTSAACALCPRPLSCFPHKVSLLSNLASSGRRPAAVARQVVSQMLAVGQPGRKLMVSAAWSMHVAVPDCLRAESLDAVAVLLLLSARQGLSALIVSRSPSSSHLHQSPLLC